MFTFDTIEEYNDEIKLLREQLRKAGNAEEWSLNTSQSIQKVRMNFGEMRSYLKTLTAERCALRNRLTGASVTGITVRRFY